MRTFLDAKVMAKALKTALASQQVSISHSQALEIVAAEFGFENWNVLSAKIGESNDRIHTNGADPPDLRREQGQRILSRVPRFPARFRASVFRQCPTLHAGFPRRPGASPERASWRRESRLDRRRQYARRPRLSARAG